MDDMTCEMFEREIGAYLEDDLPPESRLAIETHAGRCSGCAELLADLRRIGAEARALPALAPSRDLWTDIQSRIEAPVIPLVEPSPTSARPRIWQLSTRWLAAAAVLLVAFSSGLTYLATRYQPAPETGQWVVIGDPEVRPASDVPTSLGHYDEEIGELRAIIAGRRAELDSATVATIERSLHVIDDAIAESRDALARDPGSDFLHEQLDRTLARKVELMRALARMPARS